MGQKKDTKRTPRELTFIKLERRLLNSLAYKDLSDKARLGLINILYNYYGPNFSTFSCTYSTLINKMSSGTWARVQDELVEHGFIEIKHQSKGIVKSPNRFALSNKWERFGLVEFRKPKVSRVKNPNNNFQRLWKDKKNKMLEVRKNRGKQS